MANVTLTVPNKNGSYDGDVVVRQYNSVTINSGDTLTVDQPCRGLIIFCKGDMVVNGTLSMTARGASANPTVAGASDNNAVNSAGLQFGFYTSGASDSLTISQALFNGLGTSARSILANLPSGTGTNYRVHSIPRTANNGANRPSVSANSIGEVPADIRGGNGSSGGAKLGGGGAGGQAYEAYNGQGGAGGHSTCFSGGSGGGGAAGGGAATSGHRGYDAANYGGQGGQGGAHIESGSRPRGAGGAGNPGGPYGTSGVYGTVGSNGTGGFIMLVVGGNLTLGSSGKIQANGSEGGYTMLSDNSSGGGGSGGGHILIMCRGQVRTNNGSVTISPGHYVGEAGTALTSKDSYGFQTFPIQAWGGRGGQGGDGNITDAGTGIVNDMYTGTTPCRNGGTGGKGLISVYSLL